ncbi:hypothetical protein G6011_06648 [Alternaria panax]|uniref:Uncharacterized protein n=1 Tax=Alternaria panax TaxID=48097 RepID=A0AAD4I5N5_9PLEO|nr:hypothetical protein G6011_06648 [Alternaria panax]
MPFITPKKTATAIPVFVWDAFPPPPPEAEAWQPDPDSIARPGGLPDPRFNRDPEQDRQSKSFRKEAKILATPQLGGQGQAQGGSALGRGLGEWPAPPPRCTGYPRAFMADVDSAVPPLEPVPALETSYRQSATSIKSTACITGTPKGTMELLPALNYRRPETLATSKTSTKSVVSSKSLLPAWASSLEKAIAEDDGKLDSSAATTTTTSKVSFGLDTVRNKSVPPHLRGNDGDGDKARPELSSMQTPSLNLNANAKVYEGLVMRGDSDKALALAMATAELGAEHAESSLRMQQDMLDRYVTKQPTPPTTTASIPSIRAHINHDIKVKVMLIREMEHEMDLDKVAPERELIAMQRAELDRYYDKVYSAHQQWWEAMGNA